MIKRSGPLATLYGIAFGAVFAGVGVLAFVAGVREGKAGAAILAFPFLGVGLWQIVRTMRERRSAESQALTGASASLADVVPPLVLDYRTPGARSRTAAELYAPVLAIAPLPRMVTEPGVVLARALAKPSKGTVAGIVGMTIWNTVTLSVFIGAIAVKAVGFAVFMAAFVAVGGLITVLTVSDLLGRMKLPRVEVSEEPAYLGDEIDIRVEQRGPVQVNRLLVELVCRESVTYSVGTTTRDEHNDVYTRSLVDEVARNVARGERWPLQVRARLPPDLPHSFTSKRNAIRWLVRVRADIAGWPDYDEAFELRALPKVGP